MICTHLTGQIQLTLLKTCIKCLAVCPGYMPESPAAQPARAKTHHLNCIDNYLRLTAHGLRVCHIE